MSVGGGSSRTSFVIAVTAGCTPTTMACATASFQIWPRQGVSVKLAQTLARHSDVRLTLGTYTHVELQDQTAAIGMLPRTTGPLASDNGCMYVKSARKLARFRQMKHRVDAAGHAKGAEAITQPIGNPGFTTPAALVTASQKRSVPQYPL